MVLVAVLLYLAFRPGGFLAGGPRLRAEAGQWNVLLVSLDTTRPDRLSACDGGPVPTPNLARVRGGGYLLTEMIAPAPITLPAHASLFTGRNPYATGVRENTEYRLEPGDATLAGAFRDAGYTTAAFLASYVLDARFGLDQGFDLYEDRLSGPEPGLRPHNVEIPGEIVAARAAAWIAARAEGDGAGAEQPYFLFVHFFDAHAPYLPPEPFAQQWSGRPYEGELAYQDACLGIVLDALERSGEADRTLVWVVSDHGEALGEHGEPTHSLFIYDATLRAVSVLRPPPGGGRFVAGEPIARIAAQTSLIDVAPTLLEMCGLAPGWPDAEGESLLPLLQGRAGDRWTEAGGPRVVYCETMSPRISYHWSPLFGVRTTEWKYIRCPEPELYNLRTDPGEQRNVIHERAATASRLSEALDAFLARAPSVAAGDVARSALSEEERDRLRSLGYLSAGDHGGEAPQTGDSGASGEPGAGDSTALPDPKRMVRFFNEQYQHAKNLLYSGRQEEAIEAIENALAIDPLNNALHFNLGMALRYAGRPAEAARAYRTALRIEPRATRAWLGLGRSLLRQGEPDSAIVAFNRALDLLPDAPDPWMAIGDAAWTAGRHREAAAAYQEALARGGIETLLHGLLTRLYAQELDDRAQAARHLEAFARLSGLSPEEALRRLPQPEH